MFTHAINHPEFVFFRILVEGMGRKSDMNLTFNLNITFISFDSIIEM